uniref:Uncharacterized protein n=1 Tax=Cucumis melo TaxID=3656 RepID=A0A9I9DMU8_CUCME
MHQSVARYIKTRRETIVRCMENRREKSQEKCVRRRLPDTNTKRRQELGTPDARVKHVGSMGLLMCYIWHQDCLYPDTDSLVSGDLQSQPVLGASV